MMIGLNAKAGRDWDEAEALHGAAVDLYQRHGLVQNLIVAMANLSVLRLFRGHFQSAEFALMRTLALAEECGDDVRRLVAIRDRALTLARTGRLETARSEFNHALTLTRRHGTPRHHALLHEYLGELALHEGRLGVARRWLKKGYELARRTPELDIMGETRCRLAEVELRAGNVELARAIIDECLADFEKMEDLYEVAVCRRVRGEVLSAQGADDEARTAWEQALEFFEAIGERYEREKVVRLLRGDSAVGAAGGSDNLPPTPEVHSLDLAPISDFAGIMTPAPSSASPRKRGRPLVRWSHTSHADFPEIIGAHPVLLAVLDRAKQYAESDSPVLIQGETGTGKELVAAALHRLGANPTGAYLPYNCGGGSPELIDAELFGHTRGSFTGAISERLGLIRSARNGTLFLDEIGEFEENLQTRLLRFLDRGEIRVVGSDRPEQVPVRVIAATHQDLDREVGNGKFRRDLLHRFSLRLSLPPLRERRSDIVLLIDHFVREVKVRKPEFGGLGEIVIEQMLRHDWPGNVRELRNAILDLGLCTAAGRMAEDWRATVDTKEATETTTVLSREVIIAELQRSGGLVRGACSRLGISHQRFYRRCTELGIEIEAYRS